MRYRLTAESTKDKEIVEFDEEHDGEAMMTAIFSYILSSKDASIWRVGAITLENLTTGEVVNTMESKE